MASAIETGEEGLVKKIIHEQEKQEEEKKSLSPESQKNKVFMIVGATLIGFGLVALAFLIMVKNARQFKDFLITFKEKFGDYILEKEVHTVLTTHRLNEKFLFAGKTSKHSFYQDEVGNYIVDKIDIEILQILSKDARISLIDLGKRIGIDPKVAKYRIKKLEKEGIIITYTSAPNFDKLGFQFIQINFDLKNIKIIPQIIEFFDRTNKCLYALELLGKYDLTIEIHVENDRVLREIMESFKQQFVDKYNDYDIFNMYKEHLVVWLPIGL